jgi:hypothetical protein
MIFLYIFGNEEILQIVLVFLVKKLLQYYCYSFKKSQLIIERLAEFSVTQFFILTKNNTTCFQVRHFFVNQSRNKISLYPGPGGAATGPQPTCGC